MSLWQSLLYRLLVIAAGVSGLAWMWRRPHDPIGWWAVGIFVLLSLVVKRLGLRVTRDVSHSIVNVVDVGALLVVGPLGGAVVAGVSSALHQVTSLVRRGRVARYEWLDLPLFDGAVKVLLALASGALYLRLGGILAPTRLDPALLLPLTALYLAWFLLDHALWIGHYLVEGGWAAARRFIRRTSYYSLLFELAPMPFAAAFAVSWTLFDLPLRFILLVGTVLAAWGVRGFANAYREAQQRITAVSLLNKFGQEVVLAQMDEAKLATLLYEYAAQLLPHARFELVLLDERGQPRPVLADPDADSHLLPLIDELVRLFRQRPRSRLLTSFSRLALAAERRRSATERPRRGSALVIPLLANDDLLGIFLIESEVPDALTLDDGRTLSILATQAAVALQNARHFRQERWRARQLATIAEVSRMVASVIQLEDFFWQVVELIRATFGYYHVQIYIAAPARNELVYRAGSGTAGRQLVHHVKRLPLGEGIIGWVAQHGKPLLVNDVSKEPRYIPDSPRLLPDTRAELAVPLKIEERVLGVLDVQSNRIGGLGSDDLFTMNTLADQIAIAIEDARLYVAQREAAWVTAALLQVAEALNPLFELDAVLERVVRITPPLVGVDAAVIYLWHGEDDMFVGAASHGLAPPLAEALREHRVTAHQFPLLAQVRNRNQPALIDQARLGDLVRGPLARVTGDVGLVATPMQAQGEFVGVLIVGSYEELPHLSERRQTLITGIAQQAAVAIQSALLYAAQQEEAAITRDLLRVAEKIAGRAELDDLFGLVTRLTVALAQVNRCAIYLWHPDDDCLLPQAAYGFAPEVEAAWRGSALPAREVPAMALLWDAEAPILLGGEGRVPLGSEAFYDLFETTALAATPLRARGAFLGVMLVDVAWVPARLTNRLRAVLTGIARQLSIALENHQLYEEALENERRSRELELARQIQSALLPDRDPDLPGYEVAGYWRPAREVAGDFYDYLRLSHGRFAFAIADVADKGIGAALFMVLTRTAMRESLWHEEAAGPALSRINAIIAEDVRSGMFLTSFLAILSPESGHVQAANAGHLPPLHFRASDDSLRSSIRRSLPMGIRPDTRYESFDWVMEAGDWVVLTTDGLMDTINGAGERFGLHRLAELVYAHRYESARRLVTTILDAAIAHAAGEPFVDDLTIVVVKRVGQEEQSV